MLFSGIILYGEKVGERKFFLRRLTTLSLYAFGIIATLAKISADRKAGIRDSSDLDLLKYFLAEAREARYGSARISDIEKEKLGRAVFRNINKPS